jgi:starvation-inducible DNA-binding protein
MTHPPFGSRPNSGRPGHGRAGTHTETYLEDSEVIIAQPTAIVGLQTALVDLIELQTQAKHAHWNAVGPGFRSLHLELDGIVALVVDAADQVAERIRTLGGFADGRSLTVSAATTLAAFPGGTPSVITVTDLIVDRLNSVARRLRGVQESVATHDSPSSDLLNTIILSLEKARWMLQAEQT